MGQGQNKIASSLLDIQPTAILEFFRIYPDTIAKPGVFIPMHGGSVFGNNVFWQGIEYIPVPIEGEGFEVNGNGQLSRPKLRIANKDYLMSSLLQNNYDFKNAKIVRKRTFLKYLDDANFEGGNPFGSQDFTAEISDESYLVGQKLSENKLFVELELTSPLDLENFEVTNRQILAKYCYWMYRGKGCNYLKGPVEKENGYNFIDSDGNAVVPFSPTQGFLTDPTNLWSSAKPYIKGDIAYLENPKIMINPHPDDAKIDPNPKPLKTWYVCVGVDPKSEKALGKNPQSEPSYWEKDGCSKKISACKKRFSGTLPFGGFPGTDGFNYGG
mgnify:CR=1 FL=1|jgi:lambda family phage minor tail protein L